MDKWFFILCGYICDLAEAGKEGGIAPGIAFEDQPED
jgi:rubredoxin